MKKSEEEKSKDKARKNLLYIHNGIKSAFSFGKIRTWAEFYQKLGYNNTDADNRPITYPELKEYLDKQVNELERKLNNELAPKQVDAARVKETISGDSSTTTKEINSEGRIQKDVKTSCAEKEDSLTSKNNYGWIDSPSQNPSLYLYWFQRKASTEIYTKIVEGKRSILVIAEPGAGKTFMMGAVNRRLIDEHYEEGKTVAATPYLTITRVSIINQISRVLNNLFKIDVGVDLDVINIEALRSKKGKMFIKSEMKIVQGEEVEEYSFRKGLNPVVINFDESHAAKNYNSKQHKIMCSASKLDNMTVIHYSATPMARVSDAKCFAVGTKRPIEHLGFPAGTVLSEATWQSYAHIIAQGDPEEYNEAAVKRLRDDLEDYIVQVKGVKWQFRPHNTVKKIYFETKEEAEYYQKYWNTFVEQRAKLEIGTGDNPLTVLIAFSIGAETCRAPRLSKLCYDKVQTGKYQVCCGVKWKKTIIMMIRELMYKHGVPRNKISIIWGGGQTALNKKQKTKLKILKLRDTFTAQGLNADELLEDLDLDEIEAKELEEFPPEERLGTQSKEERQAEIDRFQRGETEYCFYTFRAGGIGLSLHHTDEMCDSYNEEAEGYKEWRTELEEWKKQNPKVLIKEGKVRHKESGFAFEKDIPYVKTKPRWTYLAPTYAWIDIIQGAGRTGRINSLSDTEQEIIFYGNTVEDDMSTIVGHKLRCAGAFTKVHESWHDALMGRKSVTDYVDETKETDDEEARGKALNVFSEQLEEEGEEE